MSDFSKALISEMPNSELQEKLNLFGQFIGDWDFEGVYAKDTPDEWRIPGEWLFSWILDGTAIQDIFICPSRKEREINPHPDGEYGTTIRSYDPSKDAWDICYGGHGFLHVLEARPVGNQIIVRNKDESDGLNEWVFSDITQSSFHWQNRTSYDDGATWSVNFELSARRR
ncbi:MAG: hypothetical protein FWE19_05520 [Oscillospiraceae bacterium]|nr:hypothetical protein [Oscillospiraceae bacterium]